MTKQQFFDKAYGTKPPENYERFFVPAIGEPVARDLIRRAAIQAGERVLDVACGTGIAARLAAQQVGPNGSVTGLDMNPGMLAVARTAAPPELSIEWHQASADDMPLPDGAFDVVLSQMGLQFMPDKLAALREMRRVLRPGGRLVLDMPGPMGETFAAMAEAMERHISPQAAGFVTQIFSLHDATEIRELLSEAGFDDIEVRADDKTLMLPPPKEFLWQYVHSTPLAGMVANAGDETLAAIERDVVNAWRDSVEDGRLLFRQRVVFARAMK